MAAKIINIQKGRETDPELELDMAAEVLEGLRKPSNDEGFGKTLPTMLLYDERGLRLYDDITTHAPEYYLFGAEEEILKNKSDEIVAAMHQSTGGLSANEVVLELGAGALRKTSHILLALSGLVKDVHAATPITYYALDLEERELERTLTEISHSDVGKALEGKVTTRGLCATYDQGLKFAESGALHARNTAERLPRASHSSPFKFESLESSSSSMSGSSGSDSHSDAATSPPSTPDDVQPPLHLLFLGSSLGNFSRSEGADFLRSLPLRAGSGDTILIGLDHDNGKTSIEAAYNDPQGYTKSFIMNGLKVAGRALGDENLFDEENWEYVNNYDVAERRHEAFFQAKKPHAVVIPSTKETINFAQDERIKIEQSLKFSETDAYSLFTESGLRPVQRWTDTSSRYSLWLLERPAFVFPLLSSPRTGALVFKKPYSQSPFGVPSPRDWENLWAAWDCVTQRMIPPSMLMQKPIDLRHICLFYFGHIPTFLDIHLSRLLKEPHTEPDNFKYIFERGIDPDVDDPNVCHPHSEVPKNDEDWPSLVSILQFQARVRARLLKLYEDVDAGKHTMTRKVGRVLYMTFEHEALHAETLLYMLLQRAGTGTLPPAGFMPPPWESLAESWNALPEPEEATVTLGPATVTYGHDDDEMQDDAFASDVAGHEFGWDNEHPKREALVEQFRISWRPVTNGQFYKYYMEEGDVTLPASWVEVDGQMHVRTLYGPVPMKIAQDWPVLTSYIALSKYVQVQGGRLPTEAELRLFLEKFDSGYEGGGNVGFRNWHPVPATTGAGRNGDKGGNGGVWEWTSTVFDKYEGYQQSVLYPGYSADFFDGAHQVVLGGSYATIPRIAERKSFRNWYHSKYPYAWISGRIVYDVEK